MENSKTTIKKVDIPKGRRILAVSDIHGHLEELKKVLEKAHFTEEDILFVVGDMVDKGPMSLQTLRFIMKLCEKYTAYVSIGNVDRWRMNLIEELSEENTKRLQELMQRRYSLWGKGLFVEMCEEIGAPYGTPEEIVEAQKRVMDAFQKELSFIRERPTIIETQKFIFVHGGIPHERLEELVGTEAMPYIKVDHFLEEGLSFSKWVVVGHWPVSLYDGRRSQCSPIILPKRHIISMDGGCGLKQDGQLNLLVIPDIDAEAEEISWVYYDGFPEAVALDGQEESEDSVNIRYVDNFVETLWEEVEFSWVRHLSTGRELWVLTEYLFEKDGSLRCDDFSDYRLQVKPGDTLSVIKETSKGYLAKKNGVSGWYTGRLKEEEPCITTA